MATLQSIVLAERWLDELVLQADESNIDGERNDAVLLPAGIGDVAIMTIVCEILTIATMMTVPESTGVRVHVWSAAQNIVDVVGVSPWRRVQTTALAAEVEPDALVLWRQDERLNFSFPEVDTNATPTADSRFRIRVVRVRAGVRKPSGPLQLVRESPHDTYYPGPF